MKKQGPLSRKNRDWNPLDNAAKIFPPNSGKRDTKVFRFSCKLKEDISEDVLNEALQRTLELFPLWRSVLKHGLFWYYLEQADRVPVVEKEHLPPCGPIYEKNSSRLLFDVSYYNDIINLEVYHALTDGTGAIQFLRTLVCNYLILTHDEIGSEVLSFLDYDASSVQKAEDSFKKYCDNNKTRESIKVKPAYRSKGALLPENRLRLLRGEMSAKDVLKEAHKYNTTLTIYLAALLIYAVNKEIPSRKSHKPVVLSVPVNLRQYFDSSTARNFFGVIDVGRRVYDADAALSDIIADVETDFKRELTVELLSIRMSRLMEVERNFAIRAVPLVIKDFALYFANRYNAMGSTGTLSNLGRIAMPDAVKPYISGFDVYCSTNKIQVCICSYGDVLSIGFTSPHVSTEIQKTFFRKLSATGIKVTVLSNLIDEEIDEIDSDSSENSIRRTGRNSKKEFI